MCPTNATYKNLNDMGTIIKVELFDPVNGENEYYFGSLSAIFDILTEDQVGCGLTTLWKSKITLDKKKVTRKCCISKHLIYRKDHKNERKTDS
jgi:hypothetical protein